MTPEAIANWVAMLNAGGVLALLLAILVGGFRSWWVYGHHYQQLKSDRDKLLEAQERTILVAHRALELMGDDGGEASR